LQLAVNELSRKQQGRHTTTQTILHQLEAPGGEIIDSPGFQNYQPSPIPVKEVAAGFQEMEKPAKL
jgi:ribosome biogenesis GTPase